MREFYSATLAIWPDRIRTYTGLSTSQLVTAKRNP